MELNSFYRGDRLMAQPHNLALLGPSAYFETLWKSGPLDQERVVSCRCKRLWEVLKNGLGIVLDGRRFPMHQALGTHHLPTVGHTQRLMSEADTQNRYSACKMLDGLH